tara:strand:+ start:1979 stop:2209 length:231 start_codon:yes stop_codon:yes gene_type:complete
MWNDFTCTIRFKFSVGNKVKATFNGDSKHGIIVSVSYDGRDIGNRYYVEDPLTGVGLWMRESLLTVTQKYTSDINK